MIGFILVAENAEEMLVGDCVRCQGAGLGKMEKNAVKRKGFAQILGVLLSSEYGVKDDRTTCWTYTTTIAVASRVPAWDSVLSTPSPSPSLPRPRPWSTLALAITERVRLLSISVKRCSSGWSAGRLPGLSRRAGSNAYIPGTSLSLDAPEQKFKERKKTRDKNSSLCTHGQLHGEGNSHEDAAKNTIDEKK